MSARWCRRAVPSGEVWCAFFEARPDAGGQRGQSGTNTGNAPASAGVFGEVEPFHGKAYGRDMATHAEPITLAVGGMTCAGCAANIQRGLSGLPGVESADVNVATRRAWVRPDGTLDEAELEAAMRRTITGLGYQVLTPDAAAAAGHSHQGHDHSAHSGGDHGDHEHSGHDHSRRAHDEHEAHLHADAARASDLLRRLIGAVILTVPLLVVSMVPAAQFAGWEWAAFALATPVIIGCGWPFHVSTFRSARHRAVQMDTLVTLGTLAAWTWSAVVLLAGMDAHVYFETGAVIVT